MGVLAAERIDPASYQHATGDKRTPTRYRIVELGREERVLGEVWSRSVESWQMIRGGRIRGRLIGYRRYWVATDGKGWEHRYSYTRQQAIERLAAHSGTAAIAAEQQP